MRRLFFILLCVVNFLVTSCRTHVKTWENVSYEADSMVAQCVLQDLSIKAIDTTYTEEGELTITEIEFFETADTLLYNGSTATISDLGNLHGVKSIKRTTARKRTESKGESVEQVVHEEEECIEERHEAISQEKGEDRTKKNHVMLIVLSIGGMLLVLSRFEWFRKIIRRFFQNW